jgi:hypothetical protein
MLALRSDPPDLCLLGSRITGVSHQQLAFFFFLVVEEIEDLAVTLIIISLK